MKRAVLLALAWLAAGAVVIGAQRPLQFERPPTCVFVVMMRDSLRIASFAPPCDINRRPDVDTVRTWKLESRTRTCDGILLIDAEGSANVAWMDCEGPLLRRASR